MRHQIYFHFWGSRFKLGLFDSRKRYGFDPSYFLGVGCGVSGDRMVLSFVFGEGIIMSMFHL